MKEESIAHVVTKLPATRSGCCMWSPILSIDRSSDAVGVAVGTGSNKAVLDTPPNNALDECSVES